MTHQKVVQLSVLKSWADVQEAGKKLRGAAQKKKSVVDKCQAEIIKIKEKMADDTEQYDIDIVHWERDIAEFCDFHKEEFTDKRSKDLVFMTVGFRQSSGKVDTLPKWTFKKVVAKMQEMRVNRFLVIKRDLDKTKILDLFHEKRITNDDLKVYGIEVVEPDEFWYEFKDAEAQSASIIDIKTGTGD